VLLDDGDSGLHGDVSVLGDVPVGVDGSVDLVDVDGLGSGSGFLDNLGGSGHDTSSLRNDGLLAFGNTAQVLGTSVDDGSSAVGTQRLSDAPSHAAGFTRNGLGHELCADFKSALVLGAAIGVLSLGIGSFAGLRWRDSDSTADSLARLRVLFADQFHRRNYSTLARSQRARNHDFLLD